MKTYTIYIEENEDSTQVEKQIIEFCLNNSLDFDKESLTDD